MDNALFTVVNFLGMSIMVGIVGFHYLTTTNKDYHYD